MTKIDIILTGDFVTGPDPFEVNLPEARLVLTNLEGVLFDTANLSDDNRPPLKAGPRLEGYTVPKFRSDTTVANLANNHIMDYGIHRALSTSKELSDAGLLSVGLSYESSLQRESTLVRVRNFPIEIIATSEKQFGASSPLRSGVEVYDPDLYRRIRLAKDRGHIVILSVHAGHEDIPIPSPDRKELYRSFVDAGADVIWGHHSHIPSIYEKWGGGIIFYGLGNFAVDPQKWGSNTRTLTSLVPCGEILSDGSISWSVEVAKIDENSTVLVPASSKEAQDVIRDLGDLAEIIEDEILHHGVFQLYAAQFYRDWAAEYMGWQSPKRGARWLLRTAGQLLPGRSKRRKISQTLLRFHMIACRSHSETLETALGLQCGQIPDVRTPTARALFDSVERFIGVGVRPSVEVNLG